MADKMAFNETSMIKILLVISGLLILSVIKCDDLDDLGLGLDFEEDSEESLLSVDSLVEQVRDLMHTPNPAEKLVQMAKKLATKGKAMMGVAAGLCVVAAFFPDEPSEELKAIKAGFEVVNRRLDVLASDIQNMDSVVQLSAAQAAYSKTISVINDNHQILMESIKNGKKQNMDFYTRNYKATYGMSTAMLFEAMMGSNGAFGFNLVQLYSEHVRCTPAKVANFCILGLELINKGLSCESAFLGAKNFTKQVQGLKKLWQDRLDQLTNQCKSVVAKCEAQWETISQKEFLDTYKRVLSNNHEEMTSKIVKAISGYIPQRKWMVIAYKDAGGFGEHCFSSYYKVSKIWNENSKDVSLFSVEQDSVRPNAEAWQAEVEAVVKTVGDKDYCNEKWSYKNRYDQSRSLVEVVRKKFMRGVVYAVDANKDPEAAISAGLLFVKKVKWACKDQYYKIFFFQ